MTARVMCTKLREKVKGYLNRFVDLRYDDDKLIAFFWYCEAKEKQIDLEKTSAIEFLRLLRSGRFTSPESIRRSRQKVQEDEPTLRGNKYKSRQQKAQKTRDHFANG